MKFTKRRGVAACSILVLGLVLGRVLNPHVLMQLLVMHVTFFHANITTRMWLSDLEYFGNSPRSAFLEETFPMLPDDNHSTQICRLSMYTKLAEELHAACIMTPLTDRRITLPPAERAEAYLQACLEVLRDLPEDQSAILESLFPVPPPWQFYVNVTHPWMNGRWTKPMFMSLEQILHVVPGPVYPDGSETQWEKDRSEQLASMPSFEDRLKPREEMKTLPPTLLNGLDQLGIFPVKDEHIDVKEIPDALLEGRTAIFDATKLCGKEVFNLTLADIARLHGAEAADIPVFKQNSAGFGDGTYDSLEEAGSRFTIWNEMGWQHYPHYGPFFTQAEVVAREAVTTPTDPVAHAIMSLIAGLTEQPKERIRAWLGEMLEKYRQENTQISVNVKRLPKLPLQDMEEAMGNPSWVQRIWNLLWIGPVGDFWHFDEPDNLLMCISGNLYVAVMEQPYTDIIAGTRNVGLGFNNLEGFFRHRVNGEPSWVDRNPWIKQVPIHFLHLKPGMGITVPSRTYHNVMALDGNRILMNCFFFPKWRQRKAVGPDRSWYRNGSQTDEYRALWHLRTASIWRLWDTRRIGGFFSGYKLEFF